MSGPIADLAKARILISNDDGVHASGLQTLVEIARNLSDDVWVVAPEAEQSGASHSLTLRRPLRLRKLDDRFYAVDGTPTDSVLMGVGHLLKDQRPDLVLSGVNRGGNLGEDVTYSGTIAAAMEGTLLGVPSIALSQLVTTTRVRWDTALAHGPDLIRQLATRGWPDGVLINVNFPDVAPEAVKGIDVVELGRRKIGGHLEERHDPRGVPYYWIGSMRDEHPDHPDTDLSSVYGGRIAVTPVHLDLTDREAIANVRGAFD